MSETELYHSKYAPIIDKMIANSRGAPVVTDKNVYQESNPDNKPLIHEIMQDIMLPGSRIIGFENLVKLHELAGRKKACLILMEHYSNFDIPCFFDLVESRGEQGRQVADSIVSVAGIKLNEESKLVLAFTEVFTRVVLFPGRRGHARADAEEKPEEDSRRARINLAAMKMLTTLRKEGRLILVFPTGTRYRPWDPSTARGLKEIDSYLKFYTYMVTVSINGNTLVPNPNGSMDEDYTRKDMMIYTVSPVRKCSTFRHEAAKTRLPDEDPKQHVADQVMASLARLHERTEKARQKALAETASEGKPGGSDPGR